ncbi:MAG: 6-phosphogluconate dehydrogenase, decarboxylating [Candidatus Westeberhardia cardiocondylae]|nr:6-phosphogluconate dehydrogenase, decarboxylating [Candidatus Westeberhardia cardiocondylae]
MLKQQIGIIGMAVMGLNLSLNIEKNGYSVSIFNRSKQKTNKIMDENPGKKLFPYYTIKNFVYSLQTPRIIILMIKAGKGIDDVINLMKPYLEQKDIIIDGGNTYYQDTIRREKELSIHGIYFLGAGISGGEEGALKGPAIMVGGKQYAYQYVSSIFEKISAKTDTGEKCVTYVGPNGSGHYVKMIHNAIEYASMQLISETYSLFKNILNLTNNHISMIFKKWQKGELSSYLINITSDILVQKDENNSYILDNILDIADNKGTGKWASYDALKLNEPLTITTEAVFSRYLSALKEDRIKASQVFFGPLSFIKYNINQSSYIEKIRKALYLGNVIAYAQGFSQLQNVSIKRQWNLNYTKIAKIFRNGCIIQAKLLKKIIYAYENNFNNFLLSPYFINIINDYQKSLREVVILAMTYGVPVPALSAVITYYDAYRSAILPTNLIQAQRDYFGSHSYKRIDKIGFFHTKWKQ